MNAWPRPPAGLIASQMPLLSWPERHAKAQREINRLADLVADMAERGVALETENRLLRELLGPPWWVRVRLVLARVFG